MLERAGFREPSGKILFDVIEFKGYPAKEGQSDDLIAAIWPDGFFYVFRGSVSALEHPTVRCDLEVMAEEARCEWERERV